MASVEHRDPATMAGPGGLVHQVELVIGGMTCASCAARVEKKLNRLDGVTASVNYATEKARVHYGDGITPEDLMATVAHIGYTAELPAVARPDRIELGALRERLLVCARLTIGVVAMAIAMALRVRWPISMGVLVTFGWICFAWYARIASYVQIYGTTFSDDKMSSWSGRERRSPRTGRWWRVLRC
jgi:cation transport ATPase